MSHIVTVGLLLVLLGCKDTSETSHHAKLLRIDDRYDRKITFDVIGVTVPINNPKTFLRIDGQVSDMDRHQNELLSELGVASTNLSYSNPAENGRSMHLMFADGKKCTFIWVLRTTDDRLSKIYMEHEKYHALCRTYPTGVSLLSEAIRGKGFDIDLKAHDEELSATIVETASLHLLGIPLEEISGSGLVVEAVEILKENKSNKTNAPDSAPSRPSTGGQAHRR